MTPSTDQPPKGRSRTRTSGTCRLAAATTVLALALSAPAVADELQEKLDRKSAALEQASSKQGVLTTEVDRYSRRIDSLTAQVGRLRNREAAVEAELRAAERELRAEQRNLQLVRERLQRAIATLRVRLVEIYKSGSPDVISVLLDSDGFDDLLEHSEYLQRVQEQDSNLVDQVRSLRDQAKAAVERARELRSSIAEREARLEATRIELERRESELSEARRRSRAALARVGGRMDRLEGDIAGLERKIRERLAAAQAAAAASPAAPAPLPAGPVKGAAGAQMIWPVDGTLTSPFGQRWGRLHAGLDIAAPGGTPIRAAASGTIAFTQSVAESGGYGNYTCIDHGGGLASCYAHQSAFELTSGSVKQGDVIGYVGNTGNSFGDHLHFEVRSGGNPVDPMGYL